MMLYAVEKRFDRCRAPYRVEILSDTGAPYTVREIRIFARQLGLKACFMPVKDPPRNVMPDAIFKSFKRDLIGLTPLPDAIMILPLIDRWIKNFNENHLHLGLKLHSPREFIAARNRNSLTVQRNDGKISRQPRILNHGIDPHLNLVIMG
jgi:transposase InsO family protein